MARAPTQDMTGPLSWVSAGRGLPQAWTAGEP